jgi:cytochrome bd-type quinol oxidase subunit 2
MKSFVVDNAYRLFDALTLAGLGLAIGLPGTRYWMAERVDAQQSNIYVASSAVSATLLGFMVAALTILLMLNTNRLARAYKRSGLYAKTMMLFHECAVWLTAMVVASVAGLFVDPVHGQKREWSFSDVWIWVVCALAAFLLAVRTSAGNETDRRARAGGGSTSGLRRRHS